MDKKNIDFPETVTSEQTRKPDSLWAVLAAVRFFLASIVLIEHTCGHFVVPGWFSHLNQFGAGVAVAGFFVISGYSIAHSIYTRPDGFYLRRIERIYPTYLACFLLALVPHLIWGREISMLTASYPGPKNAFEILGTMFLLNGFLVPTMDTIGTAWSLSLEIFFYALAPWFKRLSTGILVGIIGLSGVCYFNYNRFFDTVYFQQYKYAHIGHLLLGKGVILTAWMWLLGFVYYRHRNQTWAKFTLLLTGMVLLERWNWSHGDYPYFTYALVVGCLVFTPTLSRKAAKVASYLGDLSYPLYLAQSPILILLAGGNADRPWWLFVILAIVGSVVVLHAVDYPFRRLAKKWQGRQEKQAPAVARTAP